MWVSEASLALAGVLCPLHSTHARLCQSRLPLAYLNQRKRLGEGRGSLSGVWGQCGELPLTSPGADVGTGSPAGLNLT